MRARFSIAGVAYEVSGCLWGDGDQQGVIISRTDGGDTIPGATMHPGMVQQGVPARIYAAACQALRSARKAESRVDRYRGRNGGWGT